MADLVGKLTKLGKNDFNGLIAQLDGSMEVSVYDNDVLAASRFFSELEMYTIVTIPVRGYKGKTFVDMGVIAQPATPKSKKFIASLKPFFSGKKKTETDNPQTSADTEEERG